ARHVGMPGVDESRFGEHVEIGIGREAIGAKRDTNAAREKLAERMRRMAEGGVGAGTVDDGSTPKFQPLRVEVVSMSIERIGYSKTMPHETNLFRMRQQSFGIPDTQLSEERNEWSCMIFK